MPSRERPDVSIIIPVFNQANELLRCLSALEAQTYPDSQFEVIVVDNGSDPPIDQVSKAFSFARCIFEPKPGSYAARNRGIEASRAELLGFTDADCVPSETWVERGVRAIQRLSGPGSVAGKVELTFQNLNRPTAAELYQSVLGFRQQAYVEWGFAATANLFTTKATMDRVGLFDERLMSGGDQEWGQRVHALGLAQEYADDVRVRHAARLTLGQLYEKTARVAGGLQQVAEQRGLGTKGVLRRAVKQLALLRDIRAHCHDEGLDSFARKIKFAGVAWAVELVLAFECYRVHYGRPPRRT